MLKIYLTSVIIYFLVIRSTLILCENMIIKNGWLTGKKKTTQLRALYNTLILSLVPLLRLAVFVFMIVMAVMPKEKFTGNTNDDKGA